LKQSTCAILAIICSSLLCGCAHFTPPAERPITKHDMGIRWGSNEFEALAATADRRIILVSPTNGRACAEPSPDAIVSLTSALAASLGANVEDKADLEAAWARGLALNTRAITHRTQGLAFYRDMAFQACQLWMNDAIDEGEYAQYLHDAANLSAPLIEQEINLLPQLNRVSDQNSRAETRASSGKDGPDVEE